MKGNNELRLNHATMIQALQKWVDSSFVDAPIVESVEQLSSTNYCREFSIKLIDKKLEEVAND